MTYSTDTANVVSVWSTYGHRFLFDGGENTESCLTCGAMYQLLADADDLSRGKYLAAGGSEPMTCSRDTGMVHGYPGERYCHEHQHSDHECSHMAHDCNCLLCSS